MMTRAWKLPKFRICTPLKLDIYIFRFFSDTPDMEQTTILSHMQNLVQLGKEQQM